MRSTTKQRFGQAVRSRESVSQAWEMQLALGLRVVLATATVIGTLALVTQESARTELRWLLALLATSLFAVAIVETGLRRRQDRGQSRRLRGEPSAPGADVITPRATSDAPGDRATVARVPGVEGSGVRLNQLAAHRTDYVSTISHELRTPLTSILGFAQLLTREETSSSVARAYAGTIVEEADRLSRIVDDIVDLTKMETALLSLRDDVIPTKDLVAALAVRLRPTEGPGRLILEVHGGLPEIRGDRVRLEQALDRLVLTAISLSSPDSEVVLSAHAHDGQINFEISYSASPAQVQTYQRGVEDLWRCDADGVATRLGRGDVGLYVARNLVEAHGGDVRVEDLGDGQALVSVSLPY